MNPLVHAIAVPIAIARTIKDVMYLKRNGSSVEYLPKIKVTPDENTLEHLPRA